MPRNRFPGHAALLFTPALLLLVTAGFATAQVDREHAAHVHGTTAVTLAVVDGALELELTAPGMDLVGFEHAPGNSQQEQAIAAATATLERSGDWLAFEPAGSCTVVGADAHTHGFTAGSATDQTHSHGDNGHDHDAPTAHHASNHKDHDHDHDHGHDRDHGNGHDHADGHDHDGGHGEFHLRLTGTCATTPVALRIDLSARFPGIERIRVDLITDARQDRVELGAGQTRVPLSR